MDRMSPTPVTVRATPFTCYHRLFRIPYRAHLAYELEIVGHGHTMAPSKKKVSEWAMDWLACAYDNRNYEVVIEWM
jgi:hypothetical protein